MRAESLAYLACPACRGDLTIDTAAIDSATVARDGEIGEGALSCAACRATYPIRAGVPQFVRDAPIEGSGDVEQTTSAFARNWEAHNDIILDHPRLNDELFRDWVHPLDPETFEGKVVVDVGCGMGRWMCTVAPYRPRAIIGVDRSRVTATAWQNVRHLPHACVARADLFALPLKPTVDVLYCIGVVHHTPDPGGALRALPRVLAPDGVMSAWVYGRENNDWIVNWVNPVRERATSRMPHSLLLGASRALAGVLTLASAAAARAEGVPYGAYLRYLRRYPFPYLTHIVYDHLAPSISHYLSREQLDAWLREAGVAYELSARNENSWRILAARTEDALKAAKAPRSPRR